jgi:NAD(P)-dependent dehydrogenase (short-subunit alcohol dehydrogenase family)
MVNQVQPVLRVVIAGAASPVGVAMARAYEARGASVESLDLDANLNTEAERLGADKIDVLVFADDLSARSGPISSVKRSAFAPAVRQLVFAPFRAANLLRGAVAGHAGKVVLLSRRTVPMTVADDEGHYLERPFRAAQHALWKCLSVEWKSLGIDCFVIALSSSADVDAGLVSTIDGVVVPADGCELIDAHGAKLPW